MPGRRRGDGGWKKTGAGLDGNHRKQTEADEMIPLFSLCLSFSRLIAPPRHARLRDTVLGYPLFVAFASPHGPS